MGRVGGRSRPINGAAHDAARAARMVHCRESVCHPPARVRRGYNTVPVLLPALLKGFPHWSHQRVSILPSVLAASAGVSVLPVGWLVDRIEARIVMAIGALTVGVAFIIASQSNSLAPMIAVFTCSLVSVSPRAPCCRARSSWPTGSPLGAGWRWESPMPARPPAEW